jgi:hypothetical protein
MIKGSLTGTLRVPSIGSSSGTASFSATGTLTILGESAVAGSDSYSAIRHKVKYTNGFLTVVSSSGDRITTSFKGSGKTTATGIDTFKVKGPVTGGTGLYVGAAGKAVASGSFNAATGAMSFTLDITLKHT